MGNTKSKNTSDDVSDSYKKDGGDLETEKDKSVI